MVKVVTITAPFTILGWYDEDGEITDKEEDVYMYLIRDATGLEVKINAEQANERMTKVKPS